MERPPNRVVNLRSLPDDLLADCGNVWLVVGPKWRDHLKWRLQQAFNDNYSTYWMGIGDLGDKIPPSGILNGKQDLQKLVKEWSDNPTREEEDTKRVLFLEDPQGSGVWNELVKSKIFIELLSRSKELACDIIIGTGSPLVMARLVLENTDYLVLRCAGEDNIRFLTNGSRLTDWLDAIGRDLFDDIRVYRRILTIIGQKDRDLIVSLTSEADSIPERIFWWARNDRENLDVDDEDTHFTNHRTKMTSYPPNTPHPSRTHNTPQDSVHTTRTRAKVTAVIALLQEILEDL
jgi:hypothetical protein